MLVHAHSAAVAATTTATAATSGAAPRRALSYQPPPGGYAPYSPPPPPPPPLEEGVFGTGLPMVFWALALTSLGLWGSSSYYMVTNDWEKMMRRGGTGAWGARVHLEVRGSTLSRLLLGTQTKLFFLTSDRRWRS